MLRLSVELTRERIPRAQSDLDAEWRSGGPIELDLSAVLDIDSAGVAFLAAAKRRAEAEGRPLSVSGLKPLLRERLGLFPYVAPVEHDREPAGFFEQIGERGYAVRSIVWDYLLLSADVTYYAIVGLFTRRGIRWAEVQNEMAAMGSRALGIVGLISFLVGGTIALQSALQLRQFGANIFVADLIGVSLTRELGPLMAAIVVAGRSGSAVAAQLATMTITEEVDALRTMGLSPVRFLVLPKTIAIMLTQPLLTIFADVFAIFGGFLVAITYLDVGPAPFLARLQQALAVKDLLTGVIKSIVFAWLIVTIGAFIGLRTRGGADQVGRNTTMSVVSSIFAVIVADAVASLVFYFGG